MNSSECYKLYVRRLGASLTHFEFSTLALYCIIVFFLFLFLLIRKRKFLLMCFPQFVYLTPFTLISHFGTLFLFMFTALAVLDSNRRPSFARGYVFMLSGVFSIGFFPTIPFTITMMYTVFLNITPTPKSSFLNFKVTQNRLIVIMMLTFILFHFFGFEDSQFTASIPSGDHFTFRVDMLKFFLACTTTCLLLRKFCALKAIENPEKMDPREYARFVHVFLFVFVFWSIFLTQVVVALLHFSNDQSFEDGNQFGIRDSIVMQYVFVFSMLLASSKTIKKVFNRSKVVPAQ